MLNSAPPPPMDMDLNKVCLIHETMDHGLSLVALKTFSGSRNLPSLKVAACYHEN